MSDFSDRPFVAGSLIGLRAFDADKWGRLIGPSFAQVFTPGDNDAECRKSESRMAVGGWLTAPMTITYHAVDPTTNLPGETKFKLGEAAIESEAKKPKHTLGGIGCSCGFYAYFDGHNDYKNGGTIAALIEGYGVCTVGQRGFRASKARLVALVRPGKKFPAYRWEQIERNYDGVPIYTSKHEALAEHPLTQVPVLTPETDPGFWTRPVQR